METSCHLKLKDNWIVVNRRKNKYMYQLECQGYGISSFNGILRKAIYRSMLLHVKMEKGFPQIYFINLYYCLLYSLYIFHMHCVLCLFIYS